jgi:tRNA threonylcarbamoyl adenosine modification protein YeaZ
MKILALEFSSTQRSVAVFNASANGAPLGRAPVVVAGVESPLAVAAPFGLLATAAESSSGTNALGLIDQALRAASIEREHIGCIVVGLGPGSYTGIRSAIALAQGWQLGQPVRLLGVSSAECLAAQAHGLGWTGRVCIVIDAQRNEFSLAEYELNATGWQPVGSLRLAGREQVEARLRSGATVAGPEIGQWFPEGRLLFPSAATLAQLAAGRSHFVPGDKLEPIYLREAQFTKAKPPRVLPV